MDSCNIWYCLTCNERKYFQFMPIIFNFNVYQVVSFYCYFQFHCLSKLCQFLISWYVTNFVVFMILVTGCVIKTIFFSGNIYLLLHLPQTWYILASQLSLTLAQWLNWSCASVQLIILSDLPTPDRGKSGYTWKNIERFCKNELDSLSPDQD